MQTLEQKRRDRASALDYIAYFSRFNNFLFREIDTVTVDEIITFLENDKVEFFGPLSFTYEGYRFVIRRDVSTILVLSPDNPYFTVDIVTAGREFLHEQFADIRTAISAKMYFDRRTGRRDIYLPLNSKTDADEDESSDASLWDCSNCHYKNSKQENKKVCNICHSEREQDRTKQLRWNCMHCNYSNERDLVTCRCCYYPRGTRPQDYPPDRLLDLSVATKASVVAIGKWDCPDCTYHNDEKNTTCAMCNRPKSAEAISSLASDINDEKTAFSWGDDADSFMGDDEDSFMGDDALISNPFVTISSEAPAPPPELPEPAHLPEPGHLPEPDNIDEWTCEHCSALNSDNNSNCNICYQNRGTTHLLSNCQCVGGTPPVVPKSVPHSIQQYVEPDKKPLNWRCHCGKENINTLVCTRCNKPIKHFEYSVRTRSRKPNGKSFWGGKHTCRIKRKQKQIQSKRKYKRMKTRRLRK
jgi:hypothetical protein